MTAAKYEASPPLVVAVRSSSSSVSSSNIAYLLVVYQANVAVEV